MHKDPLDDFDTGHWQSKDSAWQATREAQWSEIMELLYLRNKSKKAVGIIKRYFFKGTLPDWAKLKDWDHSERNLDLMLFLYLHPSRDHAVLAPLAEAYTKSAYVVPSDIWLGMINLRSIGMIRSCSGGRSYCSRDEVEKALPHLQGLLPLLDGDMVSIEAHTQGNNERLFRLLFTDPQQQVITLADKREVQVPQHSLLDLWEWSKWLTLKLPLGQCAADMLYQYDYPLEFWYAQCGCDMPRFVRDIRDADHVSMLLRAFYRFQHFFDQHDETDPRAPFVRKCVQMIESRDFVPPIKLLWEEAKSGGVVVENIWTHESKLKRSALWSAFKAKPEWPAP